MTSGAEARRKSPESDELYRLALEVENDDALNADLADWDPTVADGQDLGVALLKNM